MRHRPPCPTRAITPNRPPAPAPGAGLLDAIEYRFRLLCAGPAPMTVDGRRLGHGLPQRRIVLDELAAVLMHPSCALAARDEVWRLLVTRARTEAECWTVGAVGVALPGLRFAAYRLSRTHTGDIQAALVAEFLTVLKTVDTTVPRLVNRLIDGATSAARTALHRTETTRSAAADAALGSTPSTATSGGHPDFVLAAAVTAGVITPGEADMIGVTRLEGITLADYADRIRLPRWTVYKRRKAAEARLVAAIHAGTVCHWDAEQVADAAGCVPDLRLERHTR
jgi:hypothetical protein